MLPTISENLDDLNTSLNTKEYKTADQFMSKPCLVQLVLCKLQLTEDGAKGDTMEQLLPPSATSLSSSDQALATTKTK